MAVYVSLERGLASCVSTETEIWLPGLVFLFLCHEHGHELTGEREIWLPRSAYAFFFLLIIVKHGHELTGDLAS